jgi:hypothetical protein
MLLQPARPVLLTEWLPQTQLASWDSLLGPDRLGQAAESGKIYSLAALGQRLAALGQRLTAFRQLSAVSGQVAPAVLEWQQELPDVCRETGPCPS